MSIELLATEMELSNCQDFTSISYAAVRFLQDSKLTIPKPVMTSRCDSLPKDVFNGEGHGELFGMPLINHNHEGNCSIASSPVPAFLTKSLSYLEEYVCTEGLFRKSGSVARQRDIRGELESGGSFPENRPHDVAALLKSFLRQLPEPLMTRRFGQVFVECVSSKQQDLLQIALFLLPAEHLHCLKVLMCFLKKVSENSSLNKMDAGSLAVVLTPNLFDLSMPGDQQNDLSLYTAVTEALIGSAEAMGSVPPHLRERGLLLSQQCEGNLPPLLLSYVKGEGEQRAELPRGTRRTRMRRKSAAFSDIMRGLGSSISRLRRASPKDPAPTTTSPTPQQRRGSASSPTTSSATEQPGGETVGAVVERKDSAKRRAESVSVSSTAKRRAVQQEASPTPPPAPSATTPRHHTGKSKRMRNFFRRKSHTDKIKRGGGGGVKFPGATSSDPSTPLRPVIVRSTSSSTVSIEPSDQQLPAVSTAVRQDCHHLHRHHCSCSSHLSSLSSAAAAVVVCPPLLLSQPTKLLQSHSYEPLSEGTDSGTTVENSPLKEEIQSRQMSFQSRSGSSSPAVSSSTTSYLYQMVTSNGTVVKCLSTGAESSGTVRYSEVVRRRRRDVQVTPSLPVCPALPSALSSAAQCHQAGTLPAPVHSSLCGDGGSHTSSTTAVKLNTVFSGSGSSGSCCVEASSINGSGSDKTAQSAPKMINPTAAALATCDLPRKQHYELRSSSRSLHSSSLLSSKMRRPVHTDLSTAENSGSSFTFSASSGALSSSAANGKSVPYDFSPFAGSMPSSGVALRQEEGDLTTSSVASTLPLSRKRPNSIGSARGEKKKVSKPVDRSHSTPSSRNIHNARHRAAAGFTFSLPEAKESVPRRRVPTREGDLYQFALPETKVAAEAVSLKQPAQASGKEAGTTHAQSEPGNSSSGEVEQSLQTAEEPSATEAATGPPASRPRGGVGTTREPGCVDPRYSLSRDCSLQAASPPWGLLEEISKEILVRKRTQGADGGLVSTTDQDLLLLNGGDGSGRTADPTSGRAGAVNKQWLTAAHPSLPPSAAERTCHTLQGGSLPSDPSVEPRPHTTGPKYSSAFRSENKQKEEKKEGYTLPSVADCPATRCSSSNSSRRVCPGFQPLGEVVAHNISIRTLTTSGRTSSSKGVNPSILSDRNSRPCGRSSSKFLGAASGKFVQSHVRPLGGQILRSPMKVASLVSFKAKRSHIRQISQEWLV